MRQLTYRIQSFHIQKGGDDVRNCGVRRPRPHPPGVPSPRGTWRAGSRCPPHREVAGAGGPAGHQLPRPATASALRRGSPSGRDQPHSVHDVDPGHRLRRHPGRRRGAGAGGDAGGRGPRPGAWFRPRHRRRGRRQQQPLRRRRLLERPAGGRRLPDDPHVDHGPGRGSARRNREGPRNEPVDPRGSQQRVVAVDRRPRHQQRRVRQGDRGSQRGNTAAGRVGRRHPGPSHHGPRRSGRRVHDPLRRAQGGRRLRAARGVLGVAHGRDLRLRDRGHLVQPRLAHEQRTSPDRSRHRGLRRQGTHAGPGAEPAGARPGLRSRWSPRPGSRRPGTPARAGTCRHGLPARLHRGAAADLAAQLRLDPPQPVPASAPSLSERIQP